MQPAGPPIAKLHIAQRFPPLQAARPFAAQAGRFQQPEPGGEIVVAAQGA